MIDLLKNIMKSDRYKSFAGIILAAVSFIICCICAQWVTGCIFAALFLAAGFIRMEFKNNIGSYIPIFVWTAVAVIATWYISLIMMDAIEYVSVEWYKRLLNLLCIVIVCVAGYIITANWKTSVVCATFILVALSTVNCFIFQFRGKELGPMDILSIRTAINVAGQYEATITFRMICGWLIWILVAFFGFSLPKLPKLSKIRSRVIMLSVETVLVVVLWACSINMHIITWNRDGTLFNGYYLNFFLGMRDFAADKPANYSFDKAQECSGKYDTAFAAAQEKLPNIIVIMDEAFADFRIFENKPVTNKEVTPFLDSLQENTIKGYALASVFGGNTANSEYEFLMGGSMALFPPESVPYQQYIRNDIFSLPWVMRAYGYKTFATHPYYESGWSRNTIYPHLGFEKSTFIDDYPAQDKIRGYISDREMFEYVMKTVGEEEKSLFLFGITMQNHGGYTWEETEYETNIRLNGYDREYPQTEEYLSLINETDIAMEYFLTELKNCGEDTVVLFFGDHFPQVESEFFDEVNGGEVDTLPEKMLKFKVPFIIWANYDIQEKNVECTSLNYLSGHLLDAAGLELSPYHRYLMDLEKDIPAMNARGYYSKEKQQFIPYDEAPEKEAELLNEYNILQYNNLFDAKHRNEIFFGRYLK